MPLWTRRRWVRPPAVTLDLDEFLRNKVLFKLRRRLGAEQITPEMHRLCLIGGLMGLVAQADGEIHERELSEIQHHLQFHGKFSPEALDVLMMVIAEESVRGLDRSRIVRRGGAEGRSTASTSASNRDQQAVIDFVATRSPRANKRGEAANLQALLSILCRRQAILRRIRADIRMQGWLGVWLYVHVPLTIALLGALTVHILSTFFYW